jgi:hypothetical protein
MFSIVYARARIIRLEPSAVDHTFTQFTENWVEKLPCVYLFKRVASWVVKLHLFRIYQLFLGQLILIKNYVLL